jgi:hypothetical protein
MSSISISDILINARTESHNMRHHYIGVEHLLTGLLTVQGGLTAAVFEGFGLSPDYVCDSIRRKIGKGGQHRVWAGVPYSRRAQQVLDDASERALLAGRNTPNERDLLLAILAERQSLAVLVVEGLGVPVQQLEEAVQSYAPSHIARQPFVRIEFGPQFRGYTENAVTQDELLILRRMFHGYSAVRLEQRLPGGHTRAHVYVVTPIQPDDREDATVIVKIGPSVEIQDEAHRYRGFVDRTLPAVAARLQAVIAPESLDIAGLMVTLVGKQGAQPRDLSQMMAEWSGERVSDWLYHSLFEQYGATWWKQTRPFRFLVWQQYDWLLPPVLTMDYDSEPPADARKLKFPVTQTSLAEVLPGTSVTIEKFTVTAVRNDPRSVDLAYAEGSDGVRPFRIRILGNHRFTEGFFRGEVVEQISGNVRSTRLLDLMEAVQGLDPPFALNDRIFAAGSLYLPNPVWAYQELLDQVVEGSLSIIHGDLHPGNILLAPGDSPQLIDFEHCREGHAAFDWANLEACLHSQTLQPLIGADWESLLAYAPLLLSYNRSNDNTVFPEALADHTLPLVAIRGIARQVLHRSTNWTEYQIALAIAALRMVTWTTSLPVGGRRMAFLLAAVAIDTLRSWREQVAYRADADDAGATEYMSTP